MPTGPLAPAPPSPAVVPQEDYFNRGKGLNEAVREQLNLPALVESGK